MPEDQKTTEQAQPEQSTRKTRKQAINEIFMLMVRAKEHVELASLSDAAEPKKNLENARLLLSDAVGKALILSNS